MSGYSVNKNTVDGSVDPRTKNHWKRHRKVEVDLLHGAPFVLDRQLEDQKYQLEFNRNPRRFENTRVEKTRSERLIQKHGNVAPITTKVKALNKIVREASGVYNYTLVPPPKRKGDPEIPEVYDPDTHPLTKPYRDAAKMNPSVCSFGHRPSSASRTFHPSTMAVRLKKGQIVKPGENGKSGFGLTPANLAKVIHAPKYVSLADSLELDKTKNAGSAFGSTSLADDPFGLFTAPPEDPDASFASAGGGEAVKSQTPEGMGSGERGRGSNNTSTYSAGGGGDGSMSMTSRSQGTANNLKKLRSESNLDISRKKKNSRALSPLPIDRPTWDDWHHRIDLELRLRQKFKLRASALDRAEIPLSERLTRYAKLTTVDVKEPKMFCKEKWDLDTALHNGTVSHSELGGRGAHNYLYDPDKEKEFIKIRKLRKKYEQEMQKKHDYNNFVNELDTVPDVPYQPAVLASSIDAALNAMGYGDRQDADGIDEMPTHATLSSTQSCAAVESVAKQVIKAPELVLDRGPFLDLTKPKSPWGRGPSDNYSVPRPKEPLLPSEKLKRFLPPDSNVPVAKDFVFSKKKGSKKSGDFPLQEEKSSSSGKKQKKGKKKNSIEDDDTDLLNVDTTPALSAEMDAVAANLLSGDVVVDNTRKAPASIPVIYCGPDWEKYYKDKKKVSTRNTEVEITKASVPSVAEYIESLRNRSDFEFENRHTYKKVTRDTTQAKSTGNRGVSHTSTDNTKAISVSERKEVVAPAESINEVKDDKTSELKEILVDRSEHNPSTLANNETEGTYSREKKNGADYIRQEEEEDNLSPPGTADSGRREEGQDSTLESPQPELDRQQVVEDTELESYEAEQPTDDDYAENPHDDDRGSSASPSRHREEDEEKYDATITYDD